MNKKVITLTILLLLSSPFKARANSNLINHNVLWGDSLWKLSLKYNTSVDQIMKINKLSSNTIYAGQKLMVQDNRITSTKESVSKVNYTVKWGDNLWSISKNYNTTMEAISKSNYINNNNISPGQILTIPVNSNGVVSPLGITMLKPKINNNYGDMYDWQNGRRLFTVDTVGTLKDLKSGITFKIKYYGGSNHSDVIPLTKSDTDNIKKIFPTWTWSSRPMILTFTQGGKLYQMAVSMSGMPHSTTNIFDNGVDGHFDLYFYNSTSHNTGQISPSHQSNIRIANGQTQ
ncbi:hypothetical protein GCM10008905_12650 [Clostridium malenominatum]|uniref:LysM domain-containing protein n=1 Tax=Clostridium malenominatum TaxID=1539 RepID=A0ABN1IUZ8_9CLOT